MRKVAWCCGLYLVINLACHLSAGTNADSRLATLFAMKEDQSFRIDRYFEMTADWARTPDGHYYSNKAPGPMLLAFPLFWLSDAWTTRGTQTRAERDRVRVQYKARTLKLLSYCLQVLPFLGLVWLLMRDLESRGVSSQAILFSTVTMLFGNTASLLMSTFYGHGLTAIFVLAMAWALLQRRACLMGLTAGGAVLCDYGSVLILAALVVGCLIWDRKLIGGMFLGGLIPFAVWNAYHVAAFGSPFIIASKYQNPFFVDLVAEKNNLWGILTPLPKVDVLLELLLGLSRGCLVVMPWLVLFLIGGKKEARPLGFVMGFSFVLLLWMNASFGGWHAGLTPGPRYLAAIFPALALLLGLKWDGWSKPVRKLACVLLGVSVFFSVLVYANHIAAPLVPLWPYYLRLTFVAPTSSVVVRMILLVVAMVFLLRLATKTEKVMRI